MSNSSKAWLRRHVNDHFVKEAKRQGYASRAAFKLLELQKKEKFFKPGMTVVDLGAAPGGWSQVAVDYVGEKGRVIAIDILLMTTIPDVTFIQGDFQDHAVLDQLMVLLNDQKVDVIISDMSPNLSGQKSIDMPRSIHLLELALDCAGKILKPSGTFLFKAFNGPGLEDFVRSVKLHFSQVKYKKPKASRSASKEIYVLARMMRK